MAHAGAVRSISAFTRHNNVAKVNIDILCANAPQAKVEVERAHKPLQDRLVKELRLAGANDIDAGNALLPAFMAGSSG